MSAARQNTYAWLAQAVSLVALAATNFTLPYFAGRDAYGALATIQASWFSTVGLIGAAGAQLIIGRGDRTELATRTRFVAALVACCAGLYAIAVFSGLLLRHAPLQLKVAAVVVGAALPIGGAAYGFFVVAGRGDRLLRATVINGIGMAILPLAFLKVFTERPTALVVGYATAFALSSAFIVVVGAPVYRGVSAQVTVPRHHGRELALLVMASLSGNVFMWVAIWIASQRVAAGDLATNRLVLNVASAGVAILPISRFAVQNAGGDGDVLAKPLTDAGYVASFGILMVPFALPIVLSIFSVDRASSLHAVLPLQMVIFPLLIGPLTTGRALGSGAVGSVALAAMGATVAAAGATVILAFRASVGFAPVWGTALHGTLTIGLIAATVPSARRDLGRIALPFLVAGVAVGGRQALPRLAVQVSLLGGAVLFALFVLARRRLRASASTLGSQGA